MNLPNERNLQISLFLLLPMALLLNQSNVIYGVNLSLADFVTFLLVIGLFFKRSLKLPRSVVCFFLILSVVLFSTTFFGDLFRFQYSAQIQAVLRDYIKLLAVFIYFVVGYNLARSADFYLVLKGFAIGAIIMALVAVATSFMEIPQLKATLYFGGNRFRGLMNDPNYFAVIQSSALMFFWSDPKIATRWRIIATCFLLFSILTSGSKTGLILIGILILFEVIRSLTLKQLHLSKVILLVLALILFLVFLPFVIKNAETLLTAVADLIPGFKRVTELFTDFEGAISDSGSSRDMAWGNALSLIKAAPIFGIGIGVYSDLAFSLFGTRTIAHNTYLQLGVEWGSLFTVLFFAYVFFHLMWESITPSKNKLSLMTRNMLLPFIVGSLSLSLNNARLFWLLLGGLIYYHHHLSDLNVQE